MDKKAEATGPVSIVGYDDTASAYSVEQGPPAYHFKKPEASSVKITRIVAGTIVIVTILAGMFYLLATYIEARNTCNHLMHQNKESQSMMFRSSPQFLPPVAEPRIAPLPDSNMLPPPPENKLPSKLSFEQESGDSDSAEDGPRDEDESKFSFPLTLSMDDIGNMMHKNQRAQVTCKLEKKKSEEIVTETPKHLETPFGNLTTDPRYLHVTGEAIVMSCRSGNQRPSRPMEEQRKSASNVFPSPHMMMMPPAGAQPMNGGGSGLSIRVIPLSAAVRMGGNGIGGQPQPQQAQFPPHPMMRPPFPVSSNSHNDIFGGDAAHRNMNGPMHRAGPGVPLPMHNEPRNAHDMHNGAESQHMPILFGGPMNRRDFGRDLLMELQQRAAEEDEEEVEEPIRNKRSLASCSCACK